VCNISGRVDKVIKVCGGGSRAAGHPFWEQLANDVDNVHTIFRQGDSVIFYVYMRLKVMEVRRKGSRNMPLDCHDGMLEDIFSSYNGFICV
jgi:hypothetical protein